MTLAAGAVGVVLVIATVLLMLVDEFPRGRIFMGIAGSTLVAGGFIGTLESKAAGAAEKVSAGATQALAGTAVEVAGLFLIAVVVARAVYKKKVGRWTTIGALLLPALAAAAGEEGGGSVILTVCRVIASVAVEIVNGLLGLIGSIGG